MEMVSTLESKEEKQSSFFLPHHAVVKPESKSTKVRVVFNASKKTGSGFSLNDVLHQGPTLQTDLIQIVLSWRNYKYVFTGDIEKMYRQILVHEDDRPYQRILFRRDAEHFVCSSQLKTVTFGVNCAPFLAIRTLLQLSKDYQKIYLEASAILKNAREDLLDEDFLKIDASSTIKTLGIRWNAISDTFFYAIDPFEIRLSTTKRQIPSVIAKLFDPVGWLGPIFSYGS